MTDKMNVIQSKQNRWFKHWKKLQSAKGRKAARSFLIEGEHLVQEALKSNIAILSFIIVKEKWTWFQSRFQFNAPVFLLPANLFASLTETQTPQGIAAEVRIPEWNKSEKHTGHTYVLLDRVQDPGNVGTIIRTAEATDVDGLWLGKGSVDPTNPKVVRSAMGSSFRLPTFTVDLMEMIPVIRRQGIQVISTSPRATNKYFDFQYADRVAFLLGNEGRGIHPELVPLIDDEVTIPMSGRTESLNVSVSTAILLYERLRQRAIACKGKQHWL